MQAIDTKIEKKLGKKVDAGTAAKLPHLVTALPGPQAKALVARDHAILSPSYTRDYPLVAKTGRGAMIEDVDGNVFLDFAAGIAVVSTGHCHPAVVAAIQKQAAELIHMSGTDFYYPNLVELAEKLAATCPRQGSQAGLFRQFRRGSHRSRHQARALSHQARQAHRLLRQLSRTHDGRFVPDRQQSRPAQAFRSAARWRISRALSQ